MRVYAQPMRIGLSVEGGGFSVVVGGLSVEVGGLSCEETQAAGTTLRPNTERNKTVPFNRTCSDSEQMGEHIQKSNTNKTPNTSRRFPNTEQRTATTMILTNTIKIPSISRYGDDDDGDDEDDEWLLRITTVLLCACMRRLCA